MDLKFTFEFKLWNHCNSRHRPGTKKKKKRIESNFLNELDIGKNQTNNSFNISEVHWC